MADRLAEISSLIKSANFDEAQVLCEQEIAQGGVPAEAHNMMAFLRLRAGDHSGAMEHARLAAAADPASAPLLVNYARTLFAAGEFDTGFAVLERASGFDPSWAEPLILAAETLVGQGRCTEAALKCQQARQLAPNHFDTDFILAEAQLSLMQPAEAIALLNAWRGRRPTDIRLFSNWACYHQYLGATPPPEHAQPGGMLTMQDVLPDPVPVFAANRAFGQMFMRHHPPAFKAVPRTISVDPSSRALRVGIISPDLRDHSVGFFIMPFFMHRNRQSVELFAYFMGEHQDATSGRFASLSDHWTSMRDRSRDSMAKTIAADQLDVLIELAGHTHGHILDIARCRLATITCTYLGYPNTTGVAAIDYRIVDSITDPPGSEGLAVEKLLRVDPCFLCYAPPADLPPVTPAPSLANGHITFGSFNHIRKLNHGGIALWASCLHAVPGSRMLLKARGLAEPRTAELVRVAFALAGISADRLDLLGYVDDPAGHLGAYRHIDIALDSVPYNGTTTTCEAMLMGVPVVSLMGNNHASRVGASLLTAVGLHASCLATTPRGFSQLATGLAADRQALQQLRTDLRDKMLRSMLCNGPAFAARLESTLRASLVHAKVSTG